MKRKITAIWPEQMNLRGGKYTFKDSNGNVIPTVWTLNTDDYSRISLRGYKEIAVGVWRKTN